VVTTAIDFERDGKQSDYIRVPYSSNSSAYGWLPVPIICIRSGDGPTLLLVAGNHGDEYEGQIALLRIAREIDPGGICGRIIIVPALNWPAVAAGTRVSPLDGLNMNRIFPGDPHGSVTSVLAHYLDTVLFPMADIVIDLHAGGKSLDHLPVAAIRGGLTDAQHLAARELATVFGIPHVVTTTGAVGSAAMTLHASAERHGGAVMTLELGGGGTVDPVGVEMAVDGIKRLMRHYGLTPEIDVRAAEPVRFMRLSGLGGAVHATYPGLFEPCARCGDRVEAGQVAGLIHFPDQPLRRPERYMFGTDGIVVCRRFRSLTEAGDCLFLLMVPEDAQT